MATFNRITLMGNLVRTPELVQTKTGTVVSDVDLAINDRTKRGDQWVEEVTFIQVTLFGRTAEVAAQYLTKGSPVLISGRLKQETWETNGEKRSKHKVIADNMQMLGTRNQANQQEQDIQEQTSA